MKWAGLVLAALVSIGATVFYGVLPQRFDRENNVVIAHEPYEISDRDAGGRSGHNSTDRMQRQLGGGICLPQHAGSVHGRAVW